MMAFSLFSRLTAHQCGWIKVWTQEGRYLFLRKFKTNCVIKKKPLMRLFPFQYRYGLLCGTTCNLIKDFENVIFDSFNL